MSKPNFFCEIEAMQTLAMNEAQDKDEDED